MANLTLVQAINLAFTQETEQDGTTEFFDAVYADIDEELRVRRDTMRTSAIGQDPSQIESRATHVEMVQ